jgi:hypothetical protein
MGEAIDSDLTPLVWPRAAGDLPRPPRMPLTPLFESLNTNGALPNVK